MDSNDPQHRLDGGDVEALLRGLRLGFIALIAAVVTAGLVIGLGRHPTSDGNPYYGDLVRTGSD